MSNYAADGPLEPPWVNDPDCLCEDECEEMCTDENCDCPYHAVNEWEWDYDRD